MGAIPVVPVPECTKTIFYVNFTPDGPHARAAQVLKEKTITSQGLISTKVDRQVNQKIAEGKLDGRNLEEIGSYRALVYAAWLREKASWLTGVHQFVVSDELTVKSSDFHADILKFALDGFVAASVKGPVERCLDSIARSIANASSSSHHKGIQYMIVTTHFYFDPITQSIDSKLRFIQFQTNESTYLVSRRKSEYKESKIKMTFSMTQADFNERLWDQIWSQYSAVHVQDLLSRIKDDTIDVPVPQ